MFDTRQVQSYLRSRGEKGFLKFLFSGPSWTTLPDRHGYMTLGATKPFLHWTIFGLFVLSIACRNSIPPTASLAQQAPVKDNVVLLNQGWSEEDRLRYYYTSQGSAVLPYDLFLNLEEAGSTDLFRSDRVAASFGLTPQPADPKYNPDGLPVGITKTTMVDGRWKGEWAGLTCAACHNAELNFKGKKIRVDGGVSTIDLTSLVSGLDDALAATIASPEKFDRLAASLNRADEAAKAELRTQLEAAAAGVNYYRTRSAVSPFPAGPYRVDALTLIHNRETDIAMGIPQNWRALLAPGKYPFVWNASHSSWVQWTGVARIHCKGI